MALENESGPERERFEQDPGSFSEESILTDKSSLTSEKEIDWVSENEGSSRWKAVDGFIEYSSRSSVSGFNESGAGGCYSF